MATLRDIRRRIGSVKKTQQITKAMKMVAAAKLRRAQERINRTRPYAERLIDVLGRVASTVDSSLNPYLEQRDSIDRVCYVIVTADRGLCGSFNSNILKRVKRELESKVGEDQEYGLITVGRKGFDHFRRRNYNILYNHVNIFRALQFEHALEISKNVSRLYLTGEYDRIMITYSKAVSAMKAEVISEQVLPLQPDDSVDSARNVDYLFEPTPEKLLNQLCPKAINILIWRALLESYAAEEGARMVAMESATDNAQEMIHNLTLYYNKVRQATITKEISEIVGGAEALK